MSLLPSRPDAEPAEDAGPRVIGVDDDDADDVLAALSSGTARTLLSALHDDPAPPSELAETCDTSLQNVQYHLGKLEAAGAVEVVETAYSEKGREMDVYAPADQPLVVFAGGEEDGSTLKTALTRLLGAVGVLALGSLIVQSLYGTIPIGAPGAGDGGSAGSEAPSGGDGGGGDGAGGGGDAVEVQGEATPDGGDGGGNVTLQAEGTTEPATSTPSGTETAEEVATAATEEPEATETAIETARETPMATEAQDTARRTATETVDAAGDAAVTTAAETARQAPEVAGGLPPGLLFFAGGLLVLAVVAVGWYLTER